MHSHVIALMRLMLTRRSGLPLSTLLMVVPVVAHALPIMDPANFTVSMTVIDYQNSPAGILPGGTSVTDQYAAIGALHDGSTTTPPGPPAMSSFSGLPGLESDFGDPDPDLPITITFTTPVTQVGAFYLMGASLDSLTLTLRRADDSIIESITVSPESMTPGALLFREGFIGIIADEPIASATLSPGSIAFVIDDLHFGVREPNTFSLVAFGIVTLSLVRRRM